eukprot:5975540-Pyramimonas_sp.AAC.1
MRPSMLSHLSKLSSAAWVVVAPGSHRGLLHGGLLLPGAGPVTTMLRPRLPPPARAPRWEPLLQVCVASASASASCNTLGAWPSSLAYVVCVSAFPASSYVPPRSGPHSPC